MSIERFFGGEGPRAPEVAFGFAPTPALMLCPMLPPANAMTQEAAQEIYRLAYERAQAALRPSRHERAQRLCWN
jgi:hypothetical protein